MKNTRSNLLMRALVLSEEDAAVYGKYLKKLPEEKRNDLWYDTYVSDCADRRASACSVFQMTNSGFVSYTHLDVYKRQTIRSVAQGRDDCVIGGHHIESKTVYRACLLYTSRIILANLVSVSASPGIS